MLVFSRTVEIEARLRLAPVRAVGREDAITLGEGLRLPDEAVSHPNYPPHAGYRCPFTVTLQAIARIAKKRLVRGDDLTELPGPPAAAAPAGW